LAQFSRPTQAHHPALLRPQHLHEEDVRQVPGDKLRATGISPSLVRTNFAGSMTNPEVRKGIEDRMQEVAIPPEAVARATALAIEQPADAEIGDILIRPTAQA